MLFRAALFLSALLTSASAAATIHPLLAVRQNVGTCQSQCSLIIQKQPDIENGTCDLSCICTNTFVTALTSCLDCLKAAGQNLPGVPTDFGSQLVDNCNAAGFPVSGGGSGSSGGSSGSSSGSGGLGGSGGTGASATGGSGSSGSTTTGGASPSKTSTSGSSSSSSGSSSSGNSNSGGISTKQNGAITVSANIGVYAAVAAFVGGIFTVVV